MAAANPSDRPINYQGHLRGLGCLIPHTARTSLPRGFHPAICVSPAVLLSLPL